MWLSPMIKWVKRKLGIVTLEQQVYKTQGALMKLQGTVRKLQNKARLGKKSMRHDEIERARKNRYKNWPKKKLATGAG